MSFRLEYGADAALLAQLARNAGRGQLATQAQQQNASDERFLLGLNEQQRQFDTSTAFRAQEADRANAARQQQLGQQAAAQQANLFNAQQNRDASIYGQELDYANAQQNRDSQFAIKGVDSMEQMAKDALLAANKMKLDPQGQRKLAELSADFRAIAAQRGVGIRDGEAYGGVLGDWLSDFNNSGLEDHEEVEPTPEEWFNEGVYTHTDGSLWARDRSGAIVERVKAPPRPLTPEEIQQNTYKLDTGETMFINPIDGKTYFSTPQKESADPNVVKPLQPTDRLSIRKQAYDELVQAERERVGLLPDGEDKTFHGPSNDAVQARMREIEAGIGGESQGGGQGDIFASLMGAIGGLGGAIAGGGQQPSAPKAINTQAEYDALPSGAIYIDAETGQQARKP
jgi:hypothetical protein